MNLARQKRSANLERLQICSRNRWRIGTAVVLHQHLAEKIRRIEIVFRQIFPEKLAPPHNVAFTHGEELQRQPLAFAIVTKDVDVDIFGYYREGKRLAL